MVEECQIRVAVLDWGDDVDGVVGEVFGVDPQCSGLDRQGAG